MKSLTILIVAFALTGCATCRQHEVVCSAIIVGIGTGFILSSGARDWHRCSVIGPDTSVPSCARRGR